MCRRTLKLAFNPSMNFRIGGVFRLLVASSILSTSWCDASAMDAVRMFKLPSGDAEKTLRQFSVQSGMEVLYPTDSAKGIKTQAVKGRRAVPVALEQMLAGTPLRAVKDQKHNIWRVVRVADSN